MKRLRGKLTYANVMVTILAFVVLAGGTAYASEALLPRNSVGTKQLKPGSVTPRKLSKSAKLALTGDAGGQGAVGAQGAPGANGAAGAEGARGPAGPTGAAGTMETAEPLLIDASAPEQPLPTTNTPLALDGQTSWTASEEQPGLLVAELALTIASNGSGGAESCGGRVEVFDNGHLVTTLNVGVDFMTPNNQTLTTYRMGSTPVAFGLTDPTETQTVTANYSPAGAACATGATFDGLRIIVEPLG